MADFIDDYDESIQQDYFPSKKKSTIEVPDFLQKASDIQTEEQEQKQAVLNNIPGNREIEEMNNLNKLAQMSKNWKDEEWKRILINAPSEIMSDELKRRLKTYEVYVKNQRENITTLTDENL